MGNCIICNGFINKYKKKAKYCSIKCSSIAKRRGAYIHCIHCKNEFYVSKCNLNRYRYCSRKCADICKSKDMINTKIPTGFMIKCGFCKKEMYKMPSRIRQTKLGIIYCGHKCQSEALKAGIAGYGFKKIYKNGNPRKHIMKQKNYVRKYEHRWIMEEHIGRKLETHEIIHHLNGDPTDNRIENLKIVDNKLHGKIEFESNDRIYRYSS